MLLYFYLTDLKDFVFSSLNSSSYYVRKSAVNFFVDFISLWAPHTPTTEANLGEIGLETFIEKLICYVINLVHFYGTPEEIIFADCCIMILKNLLDSENFKLIFKDPLNLAKSVSDCFMELPDDKDFNKKLSDFFLTIHFK